MGIQGGETMRIELKCFRTRNGLTQQEMADRLNISRLQYGRIETGTCSPTYKFMEKFADTFNEVEDIFKLFKND